jgi:hypothetical protein
VGTSTNIINILVLNTKGSSFFQSGDYIYVPGFAEASISSATWTNPELCLWQAPQNLISKYPLEPIYRRFFADENQFSYVATFFSQVLKINSASWSDLTVELAERRDHQTRQCFTSIFGAYKYIHEMNIFVFAEELR